jgi:hypothetical protein
MNSDLTPGPLEGQEPIEQLFRDVFGLAEETARRITDAEVDARLDQLLRKTGHAAPPAPEPDPACVLDAARREAREIVAAAHRAAAETAAESACAAQSAEEAARREAERIMAEAGEYSDMALNRAAAIIAGARSQAELIVADAREQVRQVITDARLRAGRVDSRERQLAPAGTCVRDCHDDWTSALLAVIYYGTVAGSNPAESHDWLRWLPAAADLRAWDAKVHLTSRSRVLKFSVDGQPDREGLGWMGRSRRLVRSWWQPRPRNVTGGCLVVARADGVVANVHIVHVPDDDAHVADLQALLAGFFRLEAAQGEQPASQDEGLASIRGNRAVRSIEASC